MNQRPLLALTALAFGLVVGCSDDGGPRRSASGDAAVDARLDDADVDRDVESPDAGVDASPLDASPPDTRVDASALDATPPDAMWLHPRPPAVAVQTTLAVASSTAGEGNRVNCAAVDAEGALVEGVAARVEVRPAQGWRVAREADGAGLEGAYIGQRAGEYAVTCVVDALGLRDASPARWDVFAGPVARVAAVVEPSSVTVGEQRAVQCIGYDAEDNRVEGADATLRVSPQWPGTHMDGERLSFERAGRYTVACEVPGATEAGTAEVQVLPAEASAIAVDVSPARDVYAVDEVASLAVVVTDAFGNSLPETPLVVTADPPLPRFGDTRFRLASPGVYTLTACIDGRPPVDPLCASRAVVVDDGAPSIRCISPATEAQALGRVRLVGQVADVLDVSTLTVGGADVGVDADGRFEALVPSVWGLNVVDVVATDAAGHSASTFCAFFASDDWVAEGAPLADALQLALAQGAVDDGPPAQPVHSLADLLRAVIDAPALLATLDGALRARNPVLPRACRQSVFGVCVLTLGAEYRGLRVRGPNSVTMTLVDDGLRLRARISNLEIDIRLLGTLTNSGTLYADNLDLDLTFGLGLEGGRPALSVRAIDAVRVGSIRSDFNGFLTGALLDLVFGAFEGTVRTTLADALRDYLRTEVDALLTGVLAGVDVSAFNTAVTLPSFTGGAPVALGIGFGISRLTSNPQRLLLGIASSVSGPVALAAPFPGVPLPPGPVAVDVPLPRAGGVSVSVGLVNQLLVAAWRGGAFEVSDPGALAGALGAGAALTLSLPNPPAAMGEDGRAALRLDFGPARVALQVPGVFDEPIHLELAAVARAAVSLGEGATLTFGGAEGITVERLALKSPDLPLSAQARATLERLMTRVVQALLDTALNGALPTLPVPDFALPASLEQFGVPAGTRLGLRGLNLTGTPSHWLVDGEFGQ